MQNKENLKKHKQNRGEIHGFICKWSVHFSH
nr:MAG TPA: hypothetical protein [Caudoviricetes sp.]